jgi:nucleolin
MSKVKATKNIDELLSSSEEEVPKKKSTKTTKAKKVVDSDDSSEESVEFLKKKTDRKESSASKNSKNSKNANAKTAKKPTKKVVESSSDESSEEVVKKAPVKAAKKPTKKVVESSSDESSEEVVKKAPVKAKKPVAKKVESSSEEESSEEVVKKAPVKAAKKPVAKKVESSSEEESSEEEVVAKKPAKAAPKKVESDEESMEFKPLPKHVEPESTCTELFVKNLPWSADENKLYEFFGTYGTVNNVKVLYDRETGKARGIAFIDFGSRAEAQKVVTDAANLMIDGRNLQVSFSDNKPQPQAGGFQKPAYGGGNQGGYGGQSQGGFEKKFHDGEKFSIFVGNLGFRTTEATVGAFFGDCGNVIDVRIAKNPEDGRPKGFAHVDFDSSEASAKAMAKAGQNLDGRDIRVDASTPRQGGGDSKFNFYFNFFIS